MSSFRQPFSTNIAKMLMSKITERKDFFISLKGLGYEYTKRPHKMKKGCVSSRTNFVPHEYLKRKHLEKTRQFLFGRD